MQPLPCFVCGIVTNIYCKDVASLRSKHTETNILTYLERFVGHDLSDDISRSSNKSPSVVCQNCIIKIDEYDELYMNASSLEDDLRDMLAKTLQKQREVDVDHDTDEAIGISDDVQKDADDQGGSPKLPTMFCNICQRNFDDFTELKNHDHKMKKTLKKVVVRKQTPIAPGTFINYNNVMIQQQTKFEQLTKAPPTLKCSLCSSMFSNRAAIKDHYKECHYDETRCDICGGLYADKEKLKEHRDRHTKIENPLECVECGRQFKARNPLTKHMATHTLEKFFVCELCGKQFTHHSSFKMHMMAHDDVREKKCLECGQRFRSTSHLNRHIRIHTNEKPYKCLICNRLFAQRYNMMSHYKSHSKESQTTLPSKVVCTVCKKQYPSRSKLKEHCEKNHYVVVSDKRNES